MEIADLKWEASADKNWITLEFNGQSGREVTGTGSTDNLKVTVTESTTVGDTDTEGYVTLTCTSCRPRITRQIKVTRCPLTTCEYEDVPYKVSYDAINENMEACAIAHTIILRGLLYYKPIQNGCLEKSETYIFPTTINVEASENTGATATERTVVRTNGNNIEILDANGDVVETVDVTPPELSEGGVVENLSVSVTQYAQQEACNCCTCESVLTGWIYTGGNISHNGTDGFIDVGTLTFKCNNCTLITGLTVTNSNLAEVKYEDGKIKFSCKPNSSCDSGPLFKITFTCDGVSKEIGEIQQDNAPNPNLSRSVVREQNCDNDEGAIVQFNEE